MNFNFVFDKEILCKIIKDINSSINTKWTGGPLSVKEIEQIFDKKL